MFLCYVIESVKSIHACHTRLLQMMLSQDPTDIDCTCMKLARIRIVEIDLFCLPRDALDANFMQTNHFHLKFYAANIVIPCILMNTIGHFGFLQNKI